MEGGRCEDIRPVTEKESANPRTEKEDEEEKSKTKQAQRVEEMSVAYTRSTSCARCIDEG